MAPRSVSEPAARATKIGSAILVFLGYAARMEIRATRRREIRRVGNSGRVSGERELKEAPRSPQGRASRWHGILVPACRGKGSAISHLPSEKAGEEKERKPPQTPPPGGEGFKARRCAAGLDLMSARGATHEPRGRRGRNARGTSQKGMSPRSPQSRASRWHGILVPPCLVISFELRR